MLSDSVTLWIMAHQGPLSTGFSRQEYWSRLPCPLQGIFPTQGLNPNFLCLLHWQACTTVTLTDIHHPQKFHCPLCVLRTLNTRSALLMNASVHNTVQSLWILLFVLLMWCITWIDLHILKQPFSHWICLTWTWCLILSMCCWIWFHFVENFLHLYSSQILADSFLVFSWPG